MPITQETTFLDLTTAQMSELTRQIRRERDEVLESRAEFPLRHADRYRRYLCDPALRPVGPWPESARLFMPTTRSVFERLHAEAWLVTMGNPLQIGATPFGEEDAGNATMASRFLRWSLGATMDWVQTSMDLLFDAMLDSVGVAKCLAWEPPWAAPSKDAKRYLERTVKIETVDLGMLGVAPDAEGLQYPEGRFVLQEFFLGKDDLWRMGQRGFDIPAADQLGFSQQMTDRKRAELEREGERVVEFHPESIPFVESYTRFRLDDEIGEEDIIVSWFPDAMVAGESHSTDANHGRIAGIRRLTDVFPQDDRPRRPFFPLTFWPQPRQWRGLNVPDRLESMQDLINRLHEQMVNYGEVSMLPYVFANTFYTGELPDLRTVRPGSTVPIDDLSQLQFAPTKSLNRHFAELISLAQVAVERDSNVTDANLGRQNVTGTGASRTATALMATLAESRKSYSMLVRRITKQFEDLLTFKFRLWQEVLPPRTYVQIFEPEDMDDTVIADAAAPRSLWDRLFSRQALSDAGHPQPLPLVARRLKRTEISGLFDVKIEVRPEEQFDRQVLLQLYELTAPEVAGYALGKRLMLKRIWAMFQQKGFDDIWPEEVALLQTEAAFLTLQAQLATAQQQLDAIQQAEAQQELAAFEGGIQQADETGEISPALAQQIQAMVAQQAPPSNGTGMGPEGA